MNDDHAFSPELQALIDDGSVFARAREVYERANASRRLNGVLMRGERYESEGNPPIAPSELIELASQEELLKLLDAIHQEQLDSIPTEE